MGQHRLSRMLAPRSIALVGASARPDSLGHLMTQGVRSDFPGQIYPVNPAYSEIDGLECHASLSALPEVPDLAILGVGAARLEQVIDEAISVGVGGAVVFNNCFLVEDSDPPLLDRLRARADEARFPVCGGNGMGFYNLDAKLLASFVSPANGIRSRGGVTVIAHSGSVFVMLASGNPRYRFNLAISAGQEIGATVADYMDYALEQPTTRAIVLFIETVRDPPGFMAALEKARQRDLPVVVLKVGRTEQSARLAQSHSGAIAGSDAAFDAVCDRYGALRTRTFDELMATAALLASGRRAAAGGLSAVSDSGGLRELMIDVAHDLGVPFASIGDATTARLAERLEYGLEPINPLDAAGGFNEGFADVFDDCLRALLDDADTAIGTFEFDARDGLVYMPRFLELSKAMLSHSEKPFFVLNSFAGSDNHEVAAELVDSGVPLINGIDNALLAVRHAFEYRDHRELPPASPPAGPEQAVIAMWRKRCAAGAPLDEAEGLALLGEFGIPVSNGVVVSDSAALLEAVEEIGYPVALKCAVPGVTHKSDSQGVCLGLTDAKALSDAYSDLESRLGSRALVQPMAPAGVELALGVVNDAQYGPLVMVGAGGTLVEILKDRRFALAPVDEAQAKRMLDRLELRAILYGARGRAPVDIERVARAVANLSVLAASLADEIAEIDVNPLIATPEGCLAVDALIVTRCP